MMLSRCKLKNLRLGYSIFACASSSIPKLFVIEGDPKPPHCSHQTHLFCSLVSSQVSADNQAQKFTLSYLINSCGLSPQGAILSSKRIKLRSAEKADSVLALLRNHGFSNSQISMVVRACPQVLQLDAEKTLLPKLEVFTSLGVAKEDLAKAITRAPTLLVTSLGNPIVPNVDFLIRTLSSEKRVVSVFNRCSRIFHQNQSKDVVPNMEVLRELGMPQSCISLFLAHFTQVLLQDQEKFGALVRGVKEIGFSFDNSTSAVALGQLGTKNSKSIMNRSRQVYMTKWGWSEDDVRSALKKFPQCMFKSEKKIMQTMDFLVNKMGLPSGIVVKFPQVMAFSLEKRVVPRCIVVKVLLLKGLIKEQLSLATVLCCLEKDFVDRYAIRYLNKVPQLQNVYRGKLGIQDV